MLTLFAANVAIEKVIHENFRNKHFFFKQGLAVSVRNDSNPVLNSNSK